MKILAPSCLFGTKSLTFGRSISDVVHILAISTACDAQGRVLFFQSVGKITHAHCTTERSGRTRIDHRTVVKHLRKITVHANGNVVMLPFTQRCDVTTASASIIPHTMQTQTDILSQSRQLTTMVKRIEQTDHRHITHIVRHPARPMTAVMTDVKRLISFGSRCRRLRRCGIGIVDTSQLLGRGTALRKDRQKTAKSAYRNQYSSHILFFTNRHSNSKVVVIFRHGLHGKTRYKE